VQGRFGAVAGLAAVWQMIDLPEYIGSYTSSLPGYHDRIEGLPLFAEGWPYLMIFGEQPFQVTPAGAIGKTEDVISYSEQ